MDFISKTTTGVSSVTLAHMQGRGSRAAWLCGVLLIGAAGASRAEHHEGGAAEPDVGHFKQFDADGDGKLSRQEYDAMLSGHGDSGAAATDGMPATAHQADVLVDFKDLDSDGDGFLNAEEISRKTQPSDR